MNKEIINSIEKLLYKKVAEKIQEKREKIATSILENANQYKGDPSVERLATQSSEEFDNSNFPSQEEQDKALREDCLKQLKKKYPEDLTTKFFGTISRLQPQLPMFNKLLILDP